MHILIVEDNALVASGIRTGLELHSLHADIAPTAAAAQSHIGARTYDACVLDLGLPDGNGLDLLRRWRAAGLAMPVLILTARGTLQDKVAGFEEGTDDYLTKPFDLPELALRLQALVRRAGGRASDRVTLGACEIDMAGASVHLRGQPVELSRREWALLEALVQARGRVLSTAQLHDRLYGLDGEVGSNTVNVHVHHLRKKLGAGVVDTVRGLGFRLGEGCGADLPHPTA
ncbi:DNA-binding response regulator, OmpR family, contains REC and winged-helix (wHTH) domain [Oryzisolibacter propanilivorax]|uniref:DNA-binding response regulator, OmpR family, contains REC and winged-helix (WHTH) domain n=1 Tax=Oryzisolibacter propanilivorax TaxID=1527607 RepID=A0A1G9U889_9BURK|nr:response regulator transcription factor [Oryzisolibacter propanilivorax]SDM56161.1 DNA-binding response regulator, OmpR family, contains REC and winged-helix (wHTH) domain [Oryzisolibacter propanilivorax]